MKEDKSLKEKKSRLKKIISLFKQHYPEAHCALNFKNPLELLIATQLSAQCTDKRVNQVTSSLFKKYQKAEDYAKATQRQLEKEVNSLGFFRNKAHNLKKSCKQLLEKHKGKVPKDFEALTHLAGVGRKTAHVVMGNGFQIPSGVVVDTHVRRLANRMGLVETQNVSHIEEQLSKYIEPKYWISFPHWMIEHGRTLCTARKPLCGVCFLSSVCLKKQVSLNKKTNKK